MIKTEPGARCKGYFVWEYRMAAECSKYVYIYNIVYPPSFEMRSTVRDVIFSKIAVDSNVRVNIFESNR